MALPSHKDALHDALTREHERQKIEEKMNDRDSQEILLDEEGVALKDLSHQRSQGNETRPPFQSTVPSSTNVVQKGWRRSTREERDHNPTDTLALGRLYERMGKLSIIPRYMVYIVPLGVLIAIPIIVGAFLPQLELGVCFPLLGETGLLIIGSEDCVDFQLGGSCVDVSLGIQNIRQTSPFSVQTYRRIRFRQHSKIRNHHRRTRSSRHTPIMDIRLLHHIHPHDDS